nr:unnamed protein product [Digitaria exilis]
MLICANNLHGCTSRLTRATHAVVSLPSLIITVLSPDHPPCNVYVHAEQRGHDARSPLAKPADLSPAAGNARRCRRGRRELLTAGMRHLRLPSRRRRKRDVAAASSSLERYAGDGGSCRCVKFVGEKYAGVGRCRRHLKFVGAKLFYLSFKPANISRNFSLLPECSKSRRLPRGPGCHTYGYTRRAHVRT